MIFCKTAEHMASDCCADNVRPLDRHVPVRGRTFRLGVTALLSACLLAALPLHAQDARALLKENPERLSNIHHSYEPPTAIVDTPAPEGYEPFYVSHYGRHGSRYHTSSRAVTRVSSIMDTLGILGCLTEEGKSLRDDLDSLLRFHEGQDGCLTTRGGIEHQGISQRMYERIPSLFHQEDRNQVVAVSSPSTRCIQSLANFTLKLSSNAPELNYTVYAGQRFMKFLAPGSTIPLNKSHQTILDSVLVARLDPTRIMNAWFTDPWFAAQHMGPYKVQNFIYNVFYAAQICQCLEMDYDVPDIYGHFTEEELYQLWYADDIANYNYFANTVENLNRYDMTGQGVLVDIVEKADRALAAGSDVAADLRFGHDSGLMSLWTFLRMENCEIPGHMADGPDLGWYCFSEMPMGSNMQMIFYKNGKDDVIVKILRNEKEVVIPSVKTWKGPYYKWKDLRNHFGRLLEIDYKNTK